MDNIPPLRLFSPVEFDSVRYDELSLRELTVDEMIALEKSTGNKLVIEQDKAFYSLTCGVPPQVIGNMKSRDWVRLKNYYWDKLGNVELPPVTSE